MATILNRELTNQRNATRDRVTHVGLTTDGTAFVPAQTNLSPAGGSPTEVIKAATKVDEDADGNPSTLRFVASISINGTTDLGGTPTGFRTVAALDGPDATDVLTRDVRDPAAPIGVQDAETVTVGVEFVHADGAA